jgi:signal transduction histidine kinase
MTQVLYNLILNAIQASAADQLVLVRTVRKKNLIAVEVSDQGCGVPQELQQKIFNPFFSTKKEGSGMGLAISKRIVHLHQGKMEFRPNNPRGSVFTIWLPAKKN